ncbi:hypothetical protein ADIMK_2658 [Marinobacterium lacunae]|uniref:Uncharacterized protein n=1 Tax=Marinobacterium lacunae TaxID=1232683 RepID=A0A081FX79_9GAMM|nr:hypothetical protein [Marinobacterium lacunae]KEA63134.1 hypothetical protein ADIMK_2658 [Marinobacterium lacunae]
MDYKVLATRNGVRLLSTGDTFSLSNALPLPDIFDAELIDILPIHTDQKLVAVVAEPIYQMLIESSQITT